MFHLVKHQEGNMKKIVALLCALLILVGCGTNNGNGNNVNVNEDAEAKVVFASVVYVETEETVEISGTSWAYTGSVKEIVAEADLAASEVIASNKLAKGTEIFTSTDVEGQIVVNTEDGVYTIFAAAE